LAYLVHLEQNMKPKEKFRKAAMFIGKVKAVLKLFSKIGAHKS